MSRQTIAKYVSGDGTRYTFKIKDKEYTFICRNLDVKAVLAKVKKEDFNTDRAMFQIVINSQDGYTYLNEAIKYDPSKQKSLVDVKPTKEVKEEEIIKPVNPKISVLKKMNSIQNELKIKKDNEVKTGVKTYTFWSADDILKAVKPLLNKYNCVIELSDKIVHFQDEGNIITKTKNKMGDPLNTSTTQSRFYIEATATLHDCETGGFIQSTANAREQNEKYGMDAPQLTGSSSSYARKFALSGLLLLDDNKDLDVGENKK